MRCRSVLDCLLGLPPDAYDIARLLLGAAREADDELVRDGYIRAAEELANFMGEEGSKLYKLALQAARGAQSPEYRDACFQWALEIVRRAQNGAHSVPSQPQAKEE